MSDAGRINGAGAAAGRAHNALTAGIATVAGWISTLIGILFGAMLLLVTAQIFFRFGLQVSVPWTEDVSRLLFIYVVYLGASAAFHERAMIVIDTVPSLWPGTAGGLALISSVVTALVTAFLFYASIPMVASSWNTSLPTVSWISNGWAYLAFTISFGLMLLHSGAHVALWLIGRRAAS
ncbi:TRAP transporter small permease subunit [Chelativorans sp.]|uniref:TRAP transporter small permease n=1 Tax=Chelativorans sp. TaxID=2203393 RepID=UPI0028115519|nr:TRAP transporter small permease subunit [Chelativorans sp.]